MSLAVVRLELFCGSVCLGSATGFYEKIAGTKFLVTNWHCVTGRNPHNGVPKSTDGITPDSVIIHNHTGDFSDVDGEIESIVLSDDAVPKRVEIDFGMQSRWKMHPYGQAIDIAVLTLDQETEGNIDCCLSNLLMEQETILCVGDNVVITGFPMGLTPTGSLPIWKSGMVATEPSRPSYGEQCFWIDSATRPGMSGSPVFKRDISSQTLNPEDVSRGSEKMLLVAPRGLSFVGIYSGRMGKADLLESQLGKVWYPSAVYETIMNGIPLDFDEIK